MTNLIWNVAIGVWSGVLIGVSAIFLFIVSISILCLLGYGMILGGIILWLKVKQIIIKFNKE